MRDSLCELSIKERSMEFKAVLAYGRRLVAGMGVIPASTLSWVRTLRHLFSAYIYIGNIDRKETIVPSILHYCFC